MSQPRQPKPVKIDHRRGQDNAFEGGAAGARLLQQHRPGHRMAEREKGRPARGFEHLPPQRVEVALIGGKIPHMAFARVRGQPFGAALPAPIQNHDVEVSIEQLGRDLEIFFEEFGPAGENCDRAGAGSAGAPARNSKAEFRRPDGRGDGAGGRRVERGDAKLHSNSLLRRARRARLSPRRPAQKQDGALLRRPFRSLHHFSRAACGRAKAL